VIYPQPKHLGHRLVQLSTNVVSAFSL